MLLNVLIPQQGWLAKGYLEIFQHQLFNNLFLRRTGRSVSVFCCLNSNVTFPQGQLLPGLLQGGIFIRENIPRQGRKP